MSRLFIGFPLRTFVVLLSFLMIHVCSFSQSLKGRVSDSQTDEALLGANVLVKETGQKGFVQLDGYFRIYVVKPGVYTLVISYTGYYTKTEAVTVSSNKANIVLIALKSSSKELMTISVTADGK